MFVYGQEISLACAREVSVCATKSQIYYIIFRSLFTLLLFVRVAMEQALLSRHISSYRHNSMKSHF